FAQKWIGTSWLVSEDVLITNRHVARIFAELRDGTSPSIKQGIGVNVNFVDDPQGREKIERIVRSIAYIEMENQRIDMALLRLNKGTSAALGLTPLTLDTRLTQVETLAVVGYPGNSLRDNPQDAFIQIFKGEFGVKRLAPGKVMSANTN